MELRLETNPACSVRLELQEGVAGKCTDAPPGGLSQNPLKQLQAGFATCREAANLFSFKKSASSGCIWVLFQELLKPSPCLGSRCKAPWRLVGRSSSQTLDASVEQPKGSRLTDLSLSFGAFAEQVAIQVQGLGPTFPSTRHNPMRRAACREGKAAIARRLRTGLPTNAWNSRSSLHRM